MGELLKFVAKIFLGTTAVATGATLIKKGMGNARNINISPKENNIKK